MKKILSIVLLCALLLSVGCTAFAETDVLANTLWKISFMGQKTNVHFYENNEVLVTNGQMNGKYTLENGVLDISGHSLGLSGSAKLDKKVNTMKVTKTTLKYNGHNISIAGTFTFKRVKPSVKKASYKKVKRGETTTLTMTFGEGTEYYIIVDKKTGEEYARGEVIDNKAVADIVFTEKTNNLYVRAYLCDKTGNPVMESQAQKAVKVSCK